MMRALAALIACAALGGAAVVGLGLYDVSSTDEHLAPTYWLLDTAMRKAVERRARSIQVPPLGDAGLRDRGARLFDEHCVPCHGAPGIAPAPFALGLTPIASSLVHTARHWSPAELYWVVRNGLKMTGMPAWQQRLDEDDRWAVVAFLQELPLLSPETYRLRVGRAGAVAAQLPAATGLAGDAGRGRATIRQYACVTCHAIPGIVGANAPVGPPLAGIAQRKLLAGAIPNTPENLVRWLLAPQRLSPGSAMPDLGLREQDAADIAAYLRTLD